MPIEADDQAEQAAEDMLTTVNRGAADAADSRQDPHAAGQAGHTHEHQYLSRMIG